MLDQFFTLTPERMLDFVEKAIDSPKTGVRATGRCLALNSMENRVYEIELDDNSKIVTKFYRPGRWSKEAILEEHQFLEDLAESEVPVVAPLKLVDGSTLSQSDDGILFAVFPKTPGRILQELTDSQLEQAGRLLARLHNVGEQRKATHRITISPSSYGAQSLEYLENANHLDPQLAASYRQIVTALIQEMTPLFENSSSHRIHGDCHLGNVLWQTTGPFFLDFDDMLVGPAIQDIWLVVRGRDDEARRQRDVLLNSYEQMRSFENPSLKLIEPLRALRMIHYSAWIGRRWQDPSFKRAFPDFGSYKYWQEQIADLNEQLSFIANRAWSVG